MNRPARQQKVRTEQARAPPGGGVLSARGPACGQTPPIAAASPLPVGRPCSDRTPRSVLNRILTQRWRCAAVTAVELDLQG